MSMFYFVVYFARKAYILILKRTAHKHAHTHRDTFNKIKLVSNENHTAFLLFC